MGATKITNWKNYGIEFLSIFIAVIAAFALNNWNDNQKSIKAESKILETIQEGLIKDIDDTRDNKGGHRIGLKACVFFRDLINGRARNLDSIEIYYFSLTRDFVSIQNTSGYQTLKSKGLELIQNDSLRTEIISLYEFEYTILRKLEEQYAEMQFHQSFFKEINQAFAPYLIFDEQGGINGIQVPIKLEPTEKQMILSYLHKIQTNRLYTLRYYDMVEQKIFRLQNNIIKELKRLKE